MKRLFAFLMLGISPFSNFSIGAISFTNFSLTSDSLRFEIGGNFPGPEPQWGRYGFFFVNPDKFASPGFTLAPNFNNSNTASFSGSQPLMHIATGWDNYGDYFYLIFENESGTNPLGNYYNFAVGEAINGIVEATWSSNAFDPGAVSYLNVFWGAADGGSVDTGIFLSTVTVPEPSSLSLLLAGGAVLMAGRRRK